MHRPDALIFDMDGLLLDTEGVYKRSWTTAAAEFGFTLTEKLYQELIGITVADAEQRLVAAFGPEFPLAKFQSTAKSGYESIIASEGIPLKSGVREMLDWAASQNLPCGVGTSTVTEEARERLAHHGILDRFTIVIGGDQVSKGKPDPEIFLKVAASLPVAPERAVVFEDAHSGVRAACAGGIPVILIPDLLPATPEIAASCVQVSSSLQEALDWLQSLPAHL